MSEFQCIDPGEKVEDLRTAMLDLLPPLLRGETVAADAAAHDPGVPDEFCLFLHRVHHSGFVGAQIEPQGFVPELTRRLKGKPLEGFMME